ncbi:ATP-binding protein [Glaciimonas sp. CA11.2]|uniref:sensor histidine kinase n=3 Tax=Glaciimonas sp. CA11.2 TaxID=3048601 RepID=UPI002AB39082|nr:ATP-binding protein [Glaciimonas sp. CA11.2]MDY7548048.1 ATP-binding protein [Glaciimonas sp. CA11.2]
MQRFNPRRSHRYNQTKTGSIFSGIRYFRLLNVIVIMVVVTIGYIWLHAGYQIGFEFDRDLNEAQRDRVVLVGHYVKHLVHEIDERDRMLRQVRADYGISSEKFTQSAQVQENHLPARALSARSSSQIPPQPSLTQRSLTQRYAPAYAGLYNELAIVGENGHVVASTAIPTVTKVKMAEGVDLSLQELFIANRDSSEDILRIGKPYQTPGTSQWVMTMSRRLLSPAGEFAGIALIRFPIEQMSYFYRNTEPLSNSEIFEPGHVNLDAESAIERVVLSSIIGLPVLTDGASMVKPIDQSHNPRNAGDGFPAADPLASRAIVYKLGPYPILVSVVFAQSAVIPSQFTHQITNYITFALVPTLLILILVFFIYRTIKRQYFVVKKYDIMRRRAVDATKRKSRFLATVVHELRTPLTSIQGYSELVRDGSTDDLSREFNDLIHQSAVHLHSLLNTLFDLARIEAGKVVIFRESIDSVTFFNYICAVHQPAAKKKSLSFGMLLATDLPIQFFSDRMRLSQILNNLLDNAIKFTAKGGVSLEVVVVKGKIRIKVLDTGSGIEKKDLAHLFEYFYQTDTVRVQRGEGLGLGLSLAKEFAELIGGAISIESQLGVGTVVELTIPIDSR